jgi:hypothetical protein
MKHTIKNLFRLNKMVLPIGTEYWTDIAGQFHREDGPAVIFPDGRGEIWYYHGLRERKVGLGPALTFGSDQYWYRRNRLERIRRYTGENYIEEIYWDRRTKKIKNLFLLAELKTNNLNFMVQKVCQDSGIGNQLHYTTGVIGNSVSGPNLCHSWKPDDDDYCFKRSHVWQILDEIELPIPVDDFYIRCLQYVPLYQLSGLKSGPKFQERVLKMSYSNAKYLREIDVSEDLALRLVHVDPRTIRKIKSPSIRVQEEVLKFRPDLISEIPDLDSTLKLKYSHELELSGVDL